MVDKSDLACMYCMVTGKVQGVWFRAGTKHEADKLGLTGYASNLPDGRVEVLACGSQQALDALYEWLKIGPEHARVSDVTREVLPWRERSGFVVR